MTAELSTDCQRCPIALRARRLTDKKCHHRMQPSNRGHAAQAPGRADQEPTCSAQDDPSRTAVAVSPAALLPVPDATTVRGLSCDAYFMSCDLPEVAS